MPRIGSSSHGESRLRMMRLVQRGDRHDPRDLTVSVRFEGQFTAAFEGGRTDGLLPGETLKNLVHATARAHGSGEIEPLGIALCERLLEGRPQITRARVEIAEQPWGRVEIGGKAQGQAFFAGTPERRIASVTSNGSQLAVVAGLENLTLMRTSGFAPPPRARSDDGVDDGLQRLLVATLAARWTYTSDDVTFGPYRQGIRAAVVETFAAHARHSVQHTLFSIADIILTNYQDIADVTLALYERPYRPADLFGAGVENLDELFVAAEEPVGVVEVTVER
jgi:urate oxidase